MYLDKLSEFMAIPNRLQFKTVTNLFLKHVSALISVYNI